MKNRRKVTKQRNGKLSRRDFMGGAAAMAAFTIVPRCVLGGNGNTPPSEKLNIAGIGVGSMGGVNVDHCSSENIVALCDVDDKYAAKTFNKYPNAKKYRDFQKMLEKQKDIEAVIIATPDHTHAVIAMMAMEMGKHVYCQKPLTHSVYEARMLTEAARKHKVITQMGNQGHSGEGIRLVCEWIWDGAIGPVREVHCWTDRPEHHATWSPGIGRPRETPAVPKTLNWDMWLGPAPYRPYHPCYVPFKWRGWCDFGSGTLGDMGCHIIDPVFWALKLSHSVSVEASSTTGNSEEIFPRASIVRYTFGARGEMPPVKLTWYNGGMMPPRPEELEDGRQMGDANGGVLFVGDKGKIMGGCFGEGARLIPESKMQTYKRPPKTIDRIGGMEFHEQDWIKACKGDKPASSNFNYAGPLTEMVLLGNIAIRMDKKKLYWDGPNMKVTNVPEANEYIHKEYRQGWTL
jgi:predicted dehydrogenase